MSAYRGKADVLLGSLIGLLMTQIGPFDSLNTGLNLVRHGSYCCNLRPVLAGRIENRRPLAPFARLAMERRQLLEQTLSTSCR